MPVGSRSTQVGRWWARAARRAWRPSGVLGKRLRENRLHPGLGYRTPKEVMEEALG
ncbi:hypothetical protein TthSNM33_09670 [Thermus thermophilus]|nr:hypothetical protein TthSNM33_09670 [Thermus thermophilus]